jgi:hypothetical protein
VEESEWRYCRKHLGARGRKDFDDMFEIPRLYISACSGAVSLVRILVEDSKYSLAVELKDDTKQTTLE